MPTQVVAFPVVSRSGVQQTPWVQLPNTVDDIQLQSQASDAVHSDPTNSILFVISVADDVNGTNAHEIDEEPWHGGTFIPKGSTVAVPNAVNVTFGPLNQYAGKFVQLAATFNKAIVIGATVTVLP